jgi:hypothetical protein
MHDPDNTDQHPPTPVSLSPSNAPLTRSDDAGPSCPAACLSSIEVAKAIGLKPVGDDPKQQVAAEMFRGSVAKIRSANEPAIP